MENKKQIARNRSGKCTRISELGILKENAVFLIIFPPRKYIHMYTASDRLWTSKRIVVQFIFCISFPPPLKLNALKTFLKLLFDGFFNMSPCFSQYSTHSDAHRSFIETRKASVFQLLGFFQIISLFLYENMCKYVCSTSNTNKNTRMITSKKKEIFWKKLKLETIEIIYMREKSERKRESFFRGFCVCLFVSEFISLSVSISVFVHYFLSISF